MVHELQETATTLSYHSQFYKKKNVCRQERLDGIAYNIIITELPTKRAHKSLIGSQHYFTLIR